MKFHDQVIGEFVDKSVKTTDWPTHIEVKDALKFATGA